MRIEDIGKRIRQRRLKIGMTQHELAVNLNISPQAISKWELGKNAPDITLLPSLAAALNSTIDYLLGHGGLITRSVSGTVMVVRIRRYYERITSVNLDQMVIFSNTFCYRATEHAIAQNGIPISYNEGCSLFMFIGTEHKDRALKAAIHLLHLCSDCSPMTMGLSSGTFFLGLIGHRNFAHQNVIGKAVQEAIMASAMIEHRTDRTLAVTPQFASAPQLAELTAEPERIEADGFEVLVFDTRTISSGGGSDRARSFTPSM